MAKKNLEIRKTVGVLIALNALQMAAIVFLAVLSVFDDNVTLDRAESFYLLMIGLVSVIGGATTIFGLYPMGRLSQKIRMMEDSLDSLNSLNNQFRAQRHDFLNHIQVVYSLIELEEYKEAHNYLERVYGDIQRISRVLKTAHPAINAILQAKSDMCRKRGIRMELEISSNLSDLSVPSWEMCRVLGNLIDNAIYALEKDTPPDSRQIAVRLREDLKQYAFEVENNGPPIPAHLWKQIFEPGFTTKGSQGEGMGLFICRQILTEHGGSLEVSSGGGRTVFTGVIPR